jgi:ribose transport system permease protein
MTAGSPSDQPAAADSTASQTASFKRQPDQPRPVAATTVSTDRDAGSPTSPRRTRGIGDLLIRFSGVVGIVLLVISFSLYLPHLFFSEVTFRTIVSNQAIAGFLALGALIPLAAGLIDLAFASIAGLSLVTCVWLSLNTGLNAWEMALVAVGIAGLCGLVSGLFVALLHLDSFIVTLGMSSLVLGISERITNSNTLYGKFAPDFVRLGQGSIGPVPYLAIALVALGVVVWVWLEHTASGRYVLAVGSNPTAARLSGIKVSRTYVYVLTVSSLVSGLAGVLLAAQVGNGSTTTGPGYLLPAIAALFLGATQIKNRPNVAGTIIAVLLLGTGIKGLQLAGAATWVTDFFNGGILLVAIAAAVLRRRTAPTT